MRTDSEVLAAVAQSLDAAGRRDRAGWVALFTPDARVEDPVGSRPNVGTAELEAFFDTFIGPRDIAYEVETDIVDGMTVLRDVTFQIQMDSRVAVTVPLFIRYVAREIDGTLKIAELQAFWALPNMVGQFAGKGLAALPPVLALSRAMLTNQGLGGAIGFLGGLRRPGRASRRAFGDLLAAFVTGDIATARARLGTAELQGAGDGPATLDDVMMRLHGASWSKVIAAGHSVLAAVHTVDGRLVVLADFGKGGVPTRVRLFGLGGR